MEDETEWLTRTQAAERLDVNVRTIDRWVKRGILERYETPTGRARFDGKDVDALRSPRRPQ